VEDSAVDTTNVVGYFSSKRGAMIVLAVLARTNDMGGKTCFSVTAHPDRFTIKPRTYYHLHFHAEAWKKVRDMRAAKNGYSSDREPPTKREIAFFVSGYLRAVNGVKPTVL